MMIKLYIAVHKIDISIKQQMQCSKKWRILRQTKSKHPTLSPQRNSWAKTPDERLGVFAFY